MSFRITESLRASIMRGALYLAPLGLTIFIIGMGYNFIENSIVGDLTAQFVKAVLPQGALGGRFPDGRIPGLALAVTLSFLCVIGGIASWHFGRKGLRLLDALFQTLPVLRVIYSPLRKVVETMESGQSRFQKVVFVDWPTPDCQTIAFVTNEFNGKDGAKHYVLFLPMMPNPTSGFVLRMPASKVTETTMTPEEGLQFGISLGVLIPPSVRLDQV
ncbi:MAG: DUF502 domain-containing protein [Candidatus Obscuribacterales bacterium]|nr:DUF502 domain-containing protein [Candidatus Obscuribacterales bacterium]